MDVILSPALLLERPAERVGAILRHFVGEILARGASAPRLDHGNASGRRALHEDKLTLGLAVQLEGEGDAPAASEPFLHLQRQDEVGIRRVALTGPHVIAGREPSRRCRASTARITYNK